MKGRRNFTWLLSGQLVSQVGDKFHMLALSFWVLSTTGSSAKMGAVLAASLVPSLVVGFFSGAIIDRCDRKRIIVGTDLLRGLMLAGFALLFYLERTPFSAILAMQLLLSVNAAFFDPAIPAVIGQIVAPKDLAAANSKHQLINSISTIAGACLAGLCVSTFGYLWAFVINAASFLLSALFECFIRIPAKAHIPGQKPGMAGMASDLQAGYRYILSKKDLLILMLMVMVIHFFVGSMEVFMPVLALTVSGDGARNLGFFQTAFGIGTIVTAAVLSVRHVSGRETAALFGSVFMMGALYVAAALVPGPAAMRFGLYLAVLCAFGGALTCAAISFRTLLQKKTDPDFAGRVFAVVNSVGNGAIPGAMILYGACLDRWDAPDMLMISGLTLMPLSIVSFLLYKETRHAHQTVIHTEPLA